MSASLAALTGFCSAGSVLANPQSSVESLLQKQDQLTQTEAEVAQVTSVSQLTDVRTTDWAFSALQSLVERYGCIAGYPDRTFRGQRSLSRFEFAAGLNACMGRMNELLTAGLADKVSKEDLATLQRLQEEFAAELGALKARVDTLESKVEKLEGQQFSTTTKLEGEAIFAVSVSGGGNNPVFGSNLVRGNGITGNRLSDSTNLNTTFASRVRLNFNTSFTGKDLLLTRLEAGNGGDFLGGVLGVSPEGSLGNVGFGSYGLDYSGLGSNIALGKLRYDFNLAPNFRVSVGPTMHVYDHVDFNSFANNESADFSSSFFINNPLVLLLNQQNGQGGI
ncbi:MAG: iron uptake porin, partial [Pseudanabaenaceae cyanobacterium]